jgi:phage terminase small subunit
MSNPTIDLTQKEREFIIAYVGKARGNATKAVIMAGYEGTRSTLHNLAYRLLNKSSVRQEIGRIYEERAATAGEILKSMEDHAFLSGKILTCFYDEEGTVEVDGRTVVVKTGRLMFDRKKARKLGVLGLVKSLKRGAKGDIVEFTDPMEAKKTLADIRGIAAEKPRRDAKPLEEQSWEELIAKAKFDPRKQWQSSN